MSDLYLAPATRVPPPGGYEALQCPGAPGLWLVVVRDWTTPDARHAWEASPGVLHLHPGMLGLSVPPALATAFPGIVSGTHTLYDALRAIRVTWPACNT